MNRYTDGFAGLFGDIGQQRTDRIGEPYMDNHVFIERKLTPVRAFDQKTGRV